MHLTKITWFVDTTDGLSLRLFDRNSTATAGTMRKVSRFHGMSEQAEACRRKAAECEQAVVLATRPDVKGYLS
jgi:hypothetical protein